MLLFITCIMFGFICSDAMSNTSNCLSMKFYCQCKIILTKIVLYSHTSNTVISVCNAAERKLSNIRALKLFLCTTITKSQTSYIQNLGPVYTDECSKVLGSSTLESVDYSESVSDDLFLSAAFSSA